MGINYFDKFKKLKDDFEELERDIYTFNKNRNNLVRNDINFDIQKVRFSLSELRRVINNWYLGKE